MFHEKVLVATIMLANHGLFTAAFAINAKPRQSDKNLCDKWNKKKKKKKKK